MKKNKEVNIFNSTNALRILSFLAENPGKEFLGREIQKATSISRAGVYIALRQLVKQKFVLKTHKGKFLMYSVAYDDPTIRQFKALKNILLLKPIVSKLKPSSKKIVLYGSRGRGEDDRTSDIDLFVLSKDPHATKEALSKIKTKRKIQAVIKTPSEFAGFREKEDVFCREVERGVVLWEEKE